MPGIAALRSKWAAGKAVRADWHCEEAYLNRYVTEEQRGRRPIFIATLRAARILAGPADAGSLISLAVAGPLRVFSLFASLSQPNFALVPVRLGPLLYQAQTGCTSSTYCLGRHTDQDYF